MHQHELTGAEECRVKKLRGIKTGGSMSAILTGFGGAQRLSELTY